jgi:hypothetical protein
MLDAMNDLVAALRERLAIVADEDSRRDSQRHMGRLRDISEKINALAAQLPASANPQLRHYLERCSYSKALALLEGAADLGV